MDNVFLHLLNMSITAGWLVLAVLVLRLVLRRAPKWIHCLLWVLVAIRLVCPVSFESVLSLIPSAETVPVDTFLYDVPSIHSGVPLVDQVVNPIISNSLAPQPMNSVNPTQVLTYLATVVWLVGIGGMLLYAVISTLRLRLQVREAAYVRENIWQCDRISTPFILGVLRPRIYLPTLLGAEEARSVVAHEQAHLSRRDHWWKPLGFLLLTVYWFNPLLWVGYVFLCRDIEAACDERVVRDMDAEGRREYSRVLLSCSAPRCMITACPLAFGETGVKSRIQSVLNYKKPAFWLVITAIVATVVAAVCLLTNPKATVSDKLDAFLTQVILEENRGEHTGDAYPTEAHTVFGVKKRFGKTIVYGMVLYEEYTQDASGSLQTQSGSHIPTVITVGKMEDGSYYLAEYWTPRDGSDYAPDIRKKFPARQQGKAFDVDGYYDTHHSRTLAAARAHFAAVQNAAIGFSNPRTFASMSWVSEATRKELYQNVPTAKGEEYLPVVAIRTRDELNAFVKKYEREMQLIWAEGDSLTPAHQLDFYDDAFFAEKALLGVYYHDGSCSVAPEIVRVSVGEEGTTLTALVDVYEPFAQDQALGQWLLMCEVEQTAIANVTQCYAMVRAHIAADTYAAAFAAPVRDASAAAELWRYRLKDQEQLYLRNMLPRLKWTDGASAEPTALWAYSFHINGYLYYVTQDYATLSDGSRYAAVEEYADFFRMMYAPKDDTTTVAPYPDAMDSTDANTFVGRVTRVSEGGGSMLMECYDRNKFTSVWVDLARFSDLNPSVGDEYVVTHSGQIMETFPPQVTAVVVARVSSTPLTTTTQRKTVVSTTTSASAGSSYRSFTGRVLEVEKERVLMKCYDEDAPAERVWVHIAHLNVSPKVGQEYIVEHEDLVMTTLPPQLTAVSMTHVSSTPKYEE